jgi:hypothetical protein
LGVLFSNTLAQNTKTTLIARIFEGLTEIDTNGTFTYTWYIGGKELEGEANHKK